MNGMMPRHLILNNANRLLTVECPNNTELISVQMEQCTYVQKVDFSGCTKLGTISEAQVLDVSGCDNLRYLNAYNTSLTSISTNLKGGNLVEIYYPKTIQEIKLANQYSLTTVGIPSTFYMRGTVNELQDNASSASIFSLINCPLVNRLNYNTNFNANHQFYDMYMNLRNSNEFSQLDDYKKMLSYATFGNGFAKATEIHIENSCHSMEYISFRGMENVLSIYLRDLPNLKGIMLGSNCSGCRWNNSPNFDADRYDLIGEFDWDTFTIIDCDNIEEFRIHEFRVNQSQTWFTFKEGTNSINLAEKFPNLKLFECNMATQNIHQIILPQTLQTFMNATWSGYSSTGYPHRWIHEKFNIDSIYFEGEHTEDYIGVDLGNHPMTDVRIKATYTPTVIGLNIKNYYCNPVFNSDKEEGSETRPIVIPQGKIDISEFKWREVSNWFAWMDFTKEICEVIYPSDWDAFLKNITRAYSMFYHCTNPDFTWEFAMRFLPLVQSENDMRTMYQYAQLKEQNDFDTDGVEMKNDYAIAQYNYGASPFQGTNLKYVKSVTLTQTVGCNGLFRNCNLVKIGDINCSGTNTWGGFGWCFRDCKSLIEVGNLNTTYTNTIEAGELFYNCYELTKIGNLNFKVNNFYSAFYECRKLTTSALRLPDMTQVTQIQNLFYNCDGLTTIHLPDITEYTTTLTNMEGTFRYCDNLQTIIIGGNTLPNTIQNMRQTYANCPALTNLIPIPDDFVYDITMHNCCGRCTALTDDAIYSVIPFRVTNIEYMYEYCDGLINPPVVEVKSDNVDARQMFQYCNGLKSLDIKFTGRLLKNAQYFAQHCDFLETIKFAFPDSVRMHTDYYQTGIQYYNMFQYCQNLRTVELDMSRLYNTNTKADFGGMFYQNKYIKTIKGLDFTFLKKPLYDFANNGYGYYDWHNDSITYGGSYDELETFEPVGKLQHSYNFRNITTLKHTKVILQHLDTVTSETLGLTYNVMDAIDDTLNEYVDPELKELALDAIHNKGWTFVVV